MIKQSIFILTMVVLFVSCVNKANKPALETLKQMQQEIDSVRIVFEGIDFDKVAAIQKEISNNASFVKQYEKYFVMDSLFVKYYGLYSASGKTISRIMKANFTQYDDKIDFSENQILALSKDIRKGLIPMDSVAIYMKDELEALKKLKGKVYGANQLLKEQFKSYEYSKKQVATYINNVKKQQAIE